MQTFEQWLVKTNESQDIEQIKKQAIDTLQQLQSFFAPFCKGSHTRGGGEGSWGSYSSMQEPVCELEMLTKRAIWHIHALKGGVGAKNYINTILQKGDKAFYRSYSDNWEQAKQPLLQLQQILSTM